MKLEFSSKLVIYNIIYDDDKQVLQMQDNVVFVLKLSTVVINKLFCVRYFYDWKLLSVMFPCLFNLS